MIYTFANAKGGVGKTTLATLFAGQKVIEGNKVILIDLDYQSNVNIVFGKSFDKNENNSILSILLELKKPSEVIDDFISEEYQRFINKNDIKGQLNIIYAEPNLRTYENKLASKQVEPKNLLKLINKLNQIYDYVIIDTAPQLQTLIQISLKMADVIVIPFETERLSQQGIFHTLKMINDDNLIKLSNINQRKYLVQVKSNPIWNLDFQIREDIKRKIKEIPNVILVDEYLPNSTLIKKSIAFNQLPFIFTNSKAKPYISLKEKCKNLFDLLK